jgi:hypothetical protein
MADKKISQLTTLAQADVAVTADFLPIVDTSATETKKATPQSVVLGALGATSGNVGIGTASPAAKLHVVGNQYRQTDATASFGFVVNTTTATTRLETLFGGSSFAVRTNGDATDKLLLDSSGNLGIGTASPQSKLHIDGGDFRNSSGTLPALSTSIVSGEIHSGITNTGTTDSGYLRLSAGGGTTLGVKAAIDIFRESGGTAGVVFYTSGTERGRIDANGNTIAGGSAALATNATNGFLYVPTCAGTPTGTPTAITGMAPIVVNTTNNKLYFYSGGAWRDAGP